MNSETNRTKMKWYQMRRVPFRWTGDFVGGALGGFGLGIMLMSGGMKCGLDLLSQNTIFVAGIVIVVIGSFVTSYVQGRHEKNNVDKMNI